MCVLVTEGYAINFGDDVVVETQDCRPISLVQTRCDARVQKWEGPLKFWQYKYDSLPL